MGSSRDASSRRPPDPEACRTFRRDLAGLEAAARRRGEEAVQPARPAALRKHLAACPSCARRHARRVERLRGLLALRERVPPRGALEGFYEAVRARASNAPPGGGMSAAFLDAPRALRRWRTAALAAGLLVVLGGAMLVTGRLGAESPAPRGQPLADPRRTLLPLWEDETWLRPASRGVMPIDFSTRGDGRFFRPLPAPPLPSEGPGEADPTWK